MTQATALILVGLTSVGALFIGTRWLRLQWTDLRVAAGKMLGCVGVIIVFFGINLAVGLLGIIVGRSLTGIFVSTYALSDVSLLGLSCLQGLFFHYWRETRGGAAEALRRMGEREIG